MADSTEPLATTDASAVEVSIATPAPVNTNSPIHTHSVTCAGWGGVILGLGLIVAAQVLPADHEALMNAGMAIVVFGVTGTTFGKSPAIR